MVFTDTDTDFDYTVWQSKPQKMRVLGWWQRIVHRLGGGLQDFAYDHSPEVEVEPPAIESTYTSRMQFYES